MRLTALPACLLLAACGAASSQPSLPAGTKVFLSAFWFNNRKESGPACTPVSTLLQGGGLQVNASASDSSSHMALAA